MAGKIVIFCKSDIILHIGVSWGAECEPENKLAKFKLADPLRRPKFLYSSKLVIFLPMGVFRGDESDTEVKISKSKITDPIWRPKFN